MRTWLMAAAGGWLALVTIGWAGMSLAADALVGSVLAVRGAVYSDAGTGAKPLTVKAPLNRGDTIVSAAGKAKVELNDGTIISIGENSRVRLADYESTSGPVKARVNLISGVLRLLSAKAAAAGTFEVETETAIAAVRGTDWLVEASAGQTAVALVSGIVAVSGRDAHVQASVVLTDAGQGTDVRRGSAPTPAARWGAQRFADTLARATFE